MSSCAVRVICRFRPINEKERLEAQGITSGIELGFVGEKEVNVSFTDGIKEKQTYTFDRIFSDPKTTQEEIYKAVAQETVENVLQGYNGTVFAYGQTGSGKSYTMFGTSDNEGIIPRAAKHIFRHIESDKSRTEYTIKCSFLEIYRETVKDLFNPKNSNLKVRETPLRGVWVEGLTEQYVMTESEVMDCLLLGEKFRTVSATNMNAVSSRSHSLFILELHQKDIDGSTKMGRMNLADLAGSEKIAKTGATGETLEEAKKINQSLSSLGNCINALVERKSGAHIPYRDSKLTHILRESLGGNSKTTLVIACSPHDYNRVETVSTLKFGKRAKAMKNIVKVNRQQSPEELKKIIAQLTAEITRLNTYIKSLEGELSNLKGPTWNLEEFKSKVISENQKPSLVAESENFGNSQEISSEISPRNLLSVLEMQVELEKLRDQSRLEKETLQDELQQIRAEFQEKEISWKSQEEELRNFKEGQKKFQVEWERKSNQWEISRKQLEFQLKELQLQLEVEAEEKKSLNSKNEEILTGVSRDSNIPAENENFNLKVQLEDLSRQNSALTKKLAQKDERISQVEEEIKRNLSQQQIFLELNEGSEARYTQMIQNLQNQLVLKDKQLEIAQNRSRISRPVIALPESAASPVKNLFEAITTIREVPARQTLGHVVKEGYLTKMGGIIK
eukprot:TRINITY_DN359_c0_g2_i1.p1 TRINITY_DN359_c0_g2~~TRINITY_DN359_c0_g2_i1.p1  ORF type:complete len:685 (-),score=277.79 TRINITY_DN359_c0_g2_i1:587-2614(-)